jgi:membrane fusion protein (multidrug efflux system)
VTLNETELAFERAKRLNEGELISPEAYEQALSVYESAAAQYEGSRIQLGYTEILAPFGGKIIQRYVDFAEQVGVGTALFRISDFDPLLCPIQVPERALPRLRVGQSAYLTVEPYPEQRFEAEVLRIRPVVDADSGTVRVTLQVQARGRLRPGMFARVYVETDRHENALVIPKAALSLESIGDTVFVADGAVASRREVELGFTEGDHVEVLSGVAENEPVIVVGQDGLSDRTPIEILEPGGGPGGPGGRGFDPSKMTPEQLEHVKEMMRSRGMSEQQIEERLRRMRERAEADAR